MKLKIFSEPTMLQNLYLYYDEETKKGVVIDPGNGGDEALSFIEDTGVEVQMILLTHAHFDHMLVMEKMRDKTGAPVLIHKDDAPILRDSYLNRSANILPQPLEFTADRLLEDGDILSVGSAILRVFHTPGHTPGGVCYYDEQSQLVFTGDTLFYQSIGRSDFDYSDGSLLISSIQKKLFTLPDGVKVYPGHMKATSIGHERKYNPFVGME